MMPEADGAPQSARTRTCCSNRVPQPMAKLDECTVGLRRSRWRVDAQDASMQALAPPPASNPHDDVFATLNDAQRAAVEHGMGDGDRRDLLPLYFGKGAVKDESTRRVYFRGVAVGVLSQDKFGGAQISRIVDVNGKSISSGAIRKLRRS